MRLFKNKTRLILLDRILQAAHSADNRHTTITHRDHLRETTWLITRWHQDHIGAGINLTREFRIKSQFGFDLIWELFLQTSRGLFELWVACAKNDCLKVDTLHIFERRKSKIDAFL